MRHRWSASTSFVLAALRALHVNPCAAVTGSAMIEEGTTAARSRGQVTRTGGLFIHAVPHGPPSSGPKICSGFIGFTSWFPSQRERNHLTRGHRCSPDSTRRINVTFALDWTKRLVSLDITSRGSNRELIDLVAKELQRHGLTPTILPNVDGTKADLVVTIPRTTGAPTAGSPSPDTPTWCRRPRSSWRPRWSVHR